MNITWPPEYAVETDVDSKTLRDQIKNGNVLVIPAENGGQPQKGSEKE